MDEDEQNVLVSEDFCEALSPNLGLQVQSSQTSAESSSKRDERLSVSAGHIQSAHLSPLYRKERSAGDVLLFDAERPASGTSSKKPFTYISSENQQSTGDESGQQHSAGVASSDRRRLNESFNDETRIDDGLHADGGSGEALGDIHDQMQVETPLHVHFAGGYKSGDTQQGNPLVNEDLRDKEESPGNAEMKQAAALYSDQPRNAIATVDNAMVPVNLVDTVQDVQVDVASKGIPVLDNSAGFGHLDRVQQAGATDFMHDSTEFMTDEGGRGEASLEMLSVAVESFENMQRQSEEALDSARKIDEIPGAVKEHVGNDFGNAPVDPETHLTLTSANYFTLKYLMNKARDESEHNGSSIINSANAIREDFRHKDHFLSLLCELAAVQQQEHELSVVHSAQIGSCGTSLVDNDAASGEPGRLSFVDLLRKQMVHAGAFTDLTADAFYEQFLRQNRAILERSVGKELNPSPSSAGISSSDGAVAALEAETRSNENSDKEAGTPSNDEIMGDLGNGGVKGELGNLLVKGGRNSGDDLKEETRDQIKRFGVGDLVWAKVKSHPWWPGQIFNAADASVAAKRIQRPGRTLVAFFGDGTFGWLQQSQLIAFRPNFEEKVKQTTMKSFCRAVAEALDEICRRMEVGLRCSHSSDAIYSKDMFPDLNAGTRKGARIKHHQDITMSRETFQPKRVLEFVHAAACSPFFCLSSGLECSDLCGHVYGFRNFMLSPKRPKSRIVPQNMVKVQKKVKSAQSSVLKGRFELGEIGDSPSSVHGKEAKRLHLVKGAMVKEQLSENRVQSPKFRTMENLLLTESDETKALEVISHEQAKGGTWLAKGKRLQVSQDCKEGKRVKGWHSLGAFGDPTDSGVDTAADSLISPDDDTKTLFDITGLHSLKKKKKGGASKSTTDTVSKKVHRQPVEVRQELLMPLSKLEETGEEEGSFLDSSTSSLSTVVPHVNLSVLPVTKEFDSAEERDKIKGELLDSKIDEVENSEKDKGELSDSKVGEDAEESEKDGGELQDSRVGDAKESEKDKGALLNLKIDDAEEGKKNKGELLDLKVGDAEESETGGGELLDLKESQSLLLGTIDHDIILKGKKQMKRLHSQEGDILGLLVKAKRRKQDTRGEVEKLPSSSPKNKDVGSKKPVKSSKLSVSMKKVVGALKGTPASLKSADNFSTKKPASVTSVEVEVKKDTNSDCGPPRNQMSALKNLDDENLNSSFTKLLNSLQVVARDPLSSANMKSSLHGVTSAFLKFRSMVFLKSSGYGAAEAGKLVLSVGNGHPFGDKKVDEKGRAGKQNLPPGRQRPGVPTSLGDRKATVKAETRSESVGQGSQRHAVQDSFSAAKAAAVRKPRPSSPIFGCQRFDVQNSTGTETASGETPLCPRNMTTGSQRLGVQELAVVARKKKSEVLQDCAAKVPLMSEVPEGFLGKRLFKERLNKEKVADSRHHSKSVKHHISRAETFSLPEKKSLIYNPADSKVAPTSLGLFMQFTEDFALPSEAQLKEMFTRFGTLETAGIRVYRNASTAQVVFKHSSDAEAAWQHAKKNRMFGHANVSYRLRHFSLSSKNDSKHFTPKNSLSETAGDLKSLLVENPGRHHHIINSLASGVERGSSVVQAHSHSPARNSSLSRADLGRSRVPVHSPVRDTSLSRAEPGGSILPAHSPVKNLLLSSAEPGGLMVRVQSPVRNSSSSSAEPGSSILPVHSPVLHQQEVPQSPSSLMALNANLLSPPSVSNVNVLSGDIQDELMKLLQQVSFIVSSSSFTSKTT